VPDAELAPESPHGIGEVRRVSDAEPIPFFDADGEHYITAPLEYDDTGEPVPLGKSSSHVRLCIGIH
jgi:hypothetical protein